MDVLGLVTPQSFRAVWVLFSEMVTGGQASWCDLDLTFQLAILTWTFKIFSGLYIGLNLRNQKVLVR